jgi:diacylglycerol kinase family enzyme
MKEALFVVNPALVGDLSALWRHCQQAAVAHGWQADLFVTEAGERSTQLHQYLAAYLAGAGGEGADGLVFAVGGDGTVRACAHDLAGTGVPLGVIARGTANLFARSLGLPSRLGAALSAGFTGAERRVDVCYADGEPFVAMAGIGVDAAVVGATPQWSKAHLGWVGYAVAALPHLAGAPVDAVLTLSGRGLATGSGRGTAGAGGGARTLERRARSVVVGNVGVVPGGFTVLPGARVDDGLIDVGVLSPRNFFEWATVARWVVGGRHTSGPGAVEHFRTVEVEVVVPEELPRQADGELLAPGRSLRVTVRPGALVVRVPRRGGGRP